jgi:hypothetical protein
MREPDKRIVALRHQRAFQITFSRCSLRTGVSAYHGSLRVLTLDEQREREEFSPI